MSADAVLCSGIAGNGGRWGNMNKVLVATSGSEKKEAADDRN